MAGEASLISLLQGPGADNTLSFAELAKNGVVLGGDNVWVPANATRSLNYIGKSYFNGDGLFQGEIAEILLYNRDLDRRGAGGRPQLRCAEVWTAQRWAKHGAGPERRGSDAGRGGPAAITGAGLVVGTVTQQSSATVPAGSVISQNPLAGASVAAGSAVDLVVLDGPGAGDGAERGGADAGRRRPRRSPSAGLVVGAVTQQSSATVPAGSVISQNPAVGHECGGRLGGRPRRVDGSGAGDGAERGGSDAGGGDQRRSPARAWWSAR